MNNLEPGEMRGLLNKIKKNHTIVNNQQSHVYQKMSSILGCFEHFHYFVSIEYMPQDAKRLNPTMSLINS